MASENKFFSGTIPEATEEDKKLAKKYLAKPPDERCRGVENAIKKGNLWLMRELFIGEPTKYLGMGKGEKLNIKRGNYSFWYGVSWPEYALMFAASSHVEKTTLLLLDLGAKLDTDLVQKVIVKGEFNTQTLDRLIDEGFSTDDEKKKIRNDGLKASILHGHLKQAGHLISRGANFESADSDKDILYSAAYGKSIAPLEFILAQDIKSQINKRFGSGLETPLHRAVSREWPEGIKALLAAGADVDAPNGAGSTPLLHAKNEDLISLLLEYGADPRIKNKNGVSPLSRAQEEWRSDSKCRALIVAAAKSLDLKESNQWVKTGETEIKHSYVMQATGHHLTEVFNFSRRERITLSLNPETKAEGLARESFDVISHKTSLEEAADELERQGGSKTARMAIYTNLVEREKKPLPGISK